jgi:hypothetical protein
MYSSRPSTCGSGSVAKSQSSFVWNWLGKAAGIFTFSERSRPPASSSSTRAEGSSDSRFARAHPAEPAPTIT